MATSINNDKDNQNGDVPKYNFTYTYEKRPAVAVITDLQPDIYL